MAYLTQPDYVKYVCSCGQLKPITNLYFCRHCLKIRCGFCICHEVDSHFCANCLENMPSSEARLKKNRCSSCFECPSCFHTLSTRATLAAPRERPAEPAVGPGGDGKVENKQQKKMYYLSCFNCRWTSRDVGIPDQPVATGGWPERSNPFTSRFNQLLEYYKAIAQREKQDKADKKYSLRGKYVTLTDKTGLTGAMARSLAGLPSCDSGSVSAIGSFVPSAASEAADALPEDYYTKEVDLKQITSMSQRLASPELQPTEVSRLHPLPRALSVKRSQRCRACDHNLTKPEYNPGSVKFKIELLAFYHVPEIKLISYEPLSAEKQTHVLLKLTNPTGHEMRVAMLQPGDIPGEKEGDEQDKKDKEPPLPSISSPIASRILSTAGARLATPDAALSVAQRDDAAEYDDDYQPPPQHQMVIWRKSNKMALKMPVTLSAEGASRRAALVLQYSYRNSVPAAGRQPPDHTLYATVVIDLPN